MNWSSDTCLRARPLLGTLVEIRADGAPRAVLHAAIDAAFAQIARIHALMSRQDPCSDLARFAQAPVGVPVTVDLDTVGVVREALEIARLSYGAFNPCIDSRDPARRADYHAMECPDDSHLLRRAAVSLDLDGIAKGHAVDCAIEVLRAHGIKRMLINAGGDLRVEGAGVETIDIRDPLAPHQAGARIPIENEALATSAAYDGATLQTAARWQGRWSISVAAPRAVHADALTKVVLNASPELAAAVLRHYGARSRTLGRAEERRHAA